MTADHVAVALAELAEEREHLYLQQAAIRGRLAKLDEAVVALKAMDADEVAQAVRGDVTTEAPGYVVTATNTPRPTPPPPEPELRCVHCQRPFTKTNALASHEPNCPGRPGGPATKPCQHCGKPYKITGLGPHEKACRARSTTSDPDHNNRTDATALRPEKAGAPELVFRNDKATGDTTRALAAVPDAPPATVTPIKAAEPVLIIKADSDDPWECSCGWTFPTRDKLVEHRRLTGGLSNKQHRIVRQPAVTIVDPGIARTVTEEQLRRGAGESWSGDVAHID